MYGCVTPVLQLECHANHTYLTQRAVVAVLKERPKQRVYVKKGATARTVARLSTFMRPQRCYVLARNRQCLSADAIDKCETVTAAVIHIAFL